MYKINIWNYQCARKNTWNSTKNEIRPKMKFDQEWIRPKIKCQTKIGGTKKQYIKPMIQKFLHPFTLNT